MGTIRRKDSAMDTRERIKVVRYITENSDNYTASDLVHYADESVVRIYRETIAEQRKIAEEEEELERKIAEHVAETEEEEEEIEDLFEDEEIVGEEKGTEQYDVY